MNRRSFLQAAVASVAGVALGGQVRRASAAAVGGKPNIVIVFADDMGYGDVTCYNPQSKIPTPRMDRLATEGMRFTDAHSPSSVCTPSRYGLLTGRYCWRTDLKRSVHFNYEPPLIEPSRLTVASLLKKEGYRTACIGKWHLGMGWTAKEGEFFDFNRPLPWPGGTMPREEEDKIDLTKPIKGGPTELGFDVFYGAATCATCNVPYGIITGDRFLEEPTEYYEGKYLEQRSGYKSPSWDDSQADVIFAREGVKFIGESAKKGEPFFLYLPASSPHEPCEPEVIPEFMRGASEAGPRGDMVSLVDWMVGQVVDALEDAGVAENTLIIVTSDNGAKPGSYNRFTHGHKSCGELRGFKGSIWEGGHRVPMIVRWPGVVEAGSVSDQLVGLQDVTATVAEALGVVLPDDAAEDSISFMPALRQDRASGAVRQDLIHHSTLGVFAIRKGDWKLIIDCDNSGDVGRGVDGNRGSRPNPEMESQLYNLADDPYELYNRIDDDREIAAELRQLAEAYQKAGRSNRPV
jgi:arylsulfatase A-like enzyme